MKNDEYFQTLLKHWTGQITVCALGTNSNEWWRLTRSVGCFHLHGAMGFAPSFALGLAVSLPKEEIWLLDSDGGLCMNLGGLLTEASTQPPNLKHFVLSNRCYQTLRGAKLVNADQTDYVTVARGTGLENVWGVNDVADLDRILGGPAFAARHAFVVSEVEPQPRDWEFEPPPPFPYEGGEAKYRFGRHLEEQLGIQVFGPRGF